MVKGLYPEDIKNSYNSIKRQSKFFEWAKDLKRSSQNKVYKKEHVKRCSTSPVIRGMQMKTNSEISTHSLKWLKLKRLTIPCVGEGVEQLELLYSTNGNVNYYYYFGKQLGSFFKS